MLAFFSTFYQKVIFLYVIIYPISYYPLKKISLVYLYMGTAAHTLLKAIPQSPLLKFAHKRQVEQLPCQN